MQDLIVEFNSVPGSDLLKNELLMKDLRYSSFGLHFIPEPPDYAIALQNAGFVKNSNKGWMATAKGRMASDALRLHEGHIIILSRKHQHGLYRAVDARLEPVVWSAVSKTYIADSTRAKLVWQKKWENITE